MLAALPSSMLYSLYGWLLYSTLSNPCYQLGFCTELISTGATHAVQLGFSQIICIQAIQIIQLAIQIKCSPIASSYPSTPSHCSHTKQYFWWNCQILRSHNDAVQQYPPSPSHWSFPILRSNQVVLLYWQVKFPNRQRLILYQ